MYLVVLKNLTQNETVKSVEMNTKEEAQELFFSLLRYCQNKDEKFQVYFKSPQLYIRQTAGRQAE